ncbi:hypothetical protein FI667_g2788, partial [Globisporangium splendens]
MNYFDPSSQRTEAMLKLRRPYDCFTELVSEDELNTPFEAPEVPLAPPLTDTPPEAPPDTVFDVSTLTLPDTPFEAPEVPLAPPLTDTPPEAPPDTVFDVSTLTLPDIPFEAPEVPLAPPLTDTPPEAPPDTVFDVSTLTLPDNPSRHQNLRRFDAHAAQTHPRGTRSPARTATHKTPQEAPTAQSSRRVDAHAARHTFEAPEVPLAPPLHRHAAEAPPDRLRRSTLPLPTYPSISPRTHHDTPPEAPPDTSSTATLTLPTHPSRHQNPARTATHQDTPPEAPPDPSLRRVDAHAARHTLRGTRSPARTATHNRHAARSTTRHSLRRVDAHAARHTLPLECNREFAHPPPHIRRRPPHQTQSSTSPARTATHRHAPAQHHQTSIPSSVDATLPDTPFGTRSRSHRHLTDTRQSPPDPVLRRVDAHRCQTYHPFEAPEVPLAPPLTDTPPEAPPRHSLRRVDASRCRHTLRGTRIPSANRHSQTPARSTTRPVRRIDAHAADTPFEAPEVPLAPPLTDTPPEAPPDTVFDVSTLTLPDIPFEAPEVPLAPPLTDTPPEAPPDTVFDVSTLTLPDTPFEAPEVPLAPPLTDTPPEAPPDTVFDVSTLVPLFV